MDPGPSRAVRATFVNLYNKGLIYRGERLVNWSPGLLSAISDLEVEHREVEGHLWRMRYPLEDGSGHVTIATTRPETYLGDTAVAVHPDDERFTGLVGKNVVLPIIGRPIPIVADEAVEAGFGAGALKVTPGHDPTDFEIGARHGLPIINIMHPDGTINEHGGPFAGKTASRPATTSSPSSSVWACSTASIPILTPSATASAAAPSSSRSSASSGS